MSPENGSRRAGDAAGSSMSLSKFSQNAAESTSRSAQTQDPARLIVRLELEAANPDRSFHRLRWLLKALIRQHHLKCVGIGPDREPRP
jgi:hypothetical protein